MIESGSKTSMFLRANNLQLVPSPLGGRLGWKFNNLFLNLRDK